MVARGDLGVEMGFAELAACRSRSCRRPATKPRGDHATQMMESMIRHIRAAKLDSPCGHGGTMRHAVGGDRRRQDPPRWWRMAQIIVAAENTRAPLHPPAHRLFATPTSIAAA